MLNGNHFRCGIVLAISLLGFGCVNRVTAQTYRSSDNYYNSTTRLNEAYASLARAKPIYKGHRMRAMQHIRAAAKLKGGTINRQKVTYGTEGDSDALLLAAQRLLEQSHHGMSDKALEHVQKAIDEISLGLSKR